MSGSGSKSQQSTSNLDNRRVIGEGGISAENSAVNVWNETLDFDVLNRAMQSIDTTTGHSYSFGSDALGFGSDALGFGKQALATSANTFSDALGFADSVSARGATTMANVFGDALGGVLGFMSGESGRNNATLSNTFSDALGFADKQSTQFGTLTANAFSDMMASQDSAVAKVLNYGGTMTDRVLDNASETTALVKDAYADAKGRGALTDKMMIGAIAAMALVAFMAVKK